MLTVGYLWEEYEKFWFFIMCQVFSIWLGLSGHSLLTCLKDLYLFWFQWHACKLWRVSKWLLKFLFKRQPLLEPVLAVTTWYSGFFLLSFVRRFACDIGQLANIWIWVSSEVITICICGYMDISRPVDYLITCYTVLTRPNKVETTVHGYNSWLSVWTRSCRCPVKLST